jgi:hypothetical protein
MCPRFIKGLDLVWQKTFHHTRTHTHTHTHTHTLAHNNGHIASKGFWRWYIYVTLRITGFIDFINHPVIKVSSFYGSQQGISFRSPEDWNRSGFRNFVLSSIQNFGWWTKSTNPVILNNGHDWHWTVIHWTAVAADYTDNATNSSLVLMMLNASWQFKLNLCLNLHHSAVMV